MNLFARFDLHTLAPPKVGDALPPEELLAWCRNGGQAWRETAASNAELDALMRELDGDRALQALPSAAARWRARLGLKAREALLGWRRADDPWDAGRLRDVDALLRFEPRRPTLIVASHRQAAARELIAARQPAWAHVVRLLISVSPSPPGT